MPEVGKWQSCFDLGVADFKAWALSCFVTWTGWVTPTPRFMPGTLGNSDVAGGPGG